MNTKQKHALLRSHIRKLAYVIAEKEKWKPFRIKFVKHIPANTNPSKNYYTIARVFQIIRKGDPYHKARGYEIYFTKDLITNFNIFEFTSHYSRNQKNNKYEKEYIHAWDLIAHELAHLKYIQHGKRFYSYNAHLLLSYFPSYIGMVIDYYSRIGGRPAFKCKEIKKEKGGGLPPT